MRHTGPDCRLDGDRPLRTPRQGHSDAHQSVLPVPGCPGEVHPAVQKACAALYGANRPLSFPAMASVPRQPFLNLVRFLVQSVLAA